MKFKILFNKLSQGIIIILVILFFLNLSFKLPFTHRGFEFIRSFPEFRFLKDFLIIVIISLLITFLFNRIKQSSFHLANPFKKINSNKYDMIILDEINTAISYNMLNLDDVLQTILSKPEWLHLVLTGRNADSKVINIADLVTEMKEVKHPYTKGIPPRKGIEY